MMQILAEARIASSKWKFSGWIWSTDDCFEYALGAFSSKQILEGI